MQPSQPSTVIACRACSAAVLALVLAGCLGSLTHAAPMAADRTDTMAASAGAPPAVEYDYQPPAPGSYQLPIIESAGDGKVLAADGNPCDLRALMLGRFTLLSFVYTRCADPTACPMVTGVLRQIQVLSAEDPLLAANLCLMTLSFDPAHDTPQVMAGYGRAQCCAKGASWVFLTAGSPTDLAPILDHYGQRVARKRNPGDVFGPLAHNVRVFLIDRQARIRNIYSQGLLDPRLVMADVRTLLLEEAQGGRP